MDNKFKTALIDADIVLYRISPICEESSEDAVYTLTFEFMDKLLKDCNAEDYMCYFSCPSEKNFRRVLTDSYKATRPKTRPKYYDLCKQIIKDNFKWTEATCCEADDLLGIAHVEDTVLCSIDKDLKQSSGWHYNFVKKEFAYVEPDEGKEFFWLQMLMGDKTDNIIGLAGIGPKKAEKLLQNVPLAEMEEYVKDLYDDPRRFDLNVNLLKIWKKPYELYYDGKELMIETENEFIEELKKLKELFQGILDNVQEG